AMSSGFSQTCAVDTSTRVWCWGDFPNSGSAATGGPEFRAQYPVDIVRARAGVESITVGSPGICIEKVSGSGACWGPNNSGQLGDGTNDENTEYHELAGVVGLKKAVSGFSSLCYLLVNGDTRCVGANTIGQLGDGTLSSRMSFAPIHISAPALVDVVAGQNHYCGIDGSANLFCWGYNLNSTIGNGTTTNVQTPVQISGLSSGVQQVSAFSGGTCALLNSGGVKCWGLNTYGEVGDGTVSRQSSPTDVQNLSSGVLQIAVGNQFACALTNQKKVMCWGWGYMGRLGNGGTTDSSVPVEVSGLVDVKQIALSSSAACALLESGKVMCWGEGGSTGDGTEIMRSTPVELTALRGVKQISGHGDNPVICAVLETSGVKCWGSRQYNVLQTAFRPEAPKLIFSEAY
ncbi:MAG: RCC1 repeat-containing protein, partial [Proteobacteria bacterium]